MKFFNDKNTQQLNQPGENGRREKNTKSGSQCTLLEFFMAFLCNQIVFLTAYEKDELIVGNKRGHIPISLTKMQLFYRIPSCQG